MLIFNDEKKGFSRRHSAKEIRISILIIILAVIFFFLTAPPLLKYMQREDLTYKIVEQSDQINNKVIGIYDDKGHSFVTFSDSTKICFRHSRNYSYKNPYLNTFIAIGDSIVKHHGSDTLKIIRGNSSYYFILGKFINQPK